MRLTASAFGGGAVPASAEQAQALARGKYGQMGTALLESGVASEIQNAGTPEGQRQIWQRFLTDQYNAGNITTQEFARLGATDPSGLLKELGPVDDIGRYVEARRAMELQYKTYQNRSSGLSYLRGGSAAQELVEGLYANQNVAGAKELDPVRQEQMWDDMTQMAIDDPERAAELASALEESGDANSIMVASVLRGSQQKYRKIGKIAGRRGSRTLESEGDVADILRLGVTDPRARAFIKQVQKDDHLDLMSLTQLSRLADLSDDNPQQKAYIQELQRALADDKVIDEKEQLRLSRFASQVPPELSGQYSVGAGGPQFMAEMTRFAESNQKLANALTEYEREKAKS